MYGRKSTRWNYWGVSVSPMSTTSTPRMNERQVGVGRTRVASSEPGCQAVPAHACPSYLRTECGGRGRRRSALGGLAPGIMHLPDGPLAIGEYQGTHHAEVSREVPCEHGAKLPFTRELSQFAKAKAVSSPSSGHGTTSWRKQVGPMPRGASTCGKTSSAVFCHLGDSAAGSVHDLMGDLAPGLSHKFAATAPVDAALVCQQLSTSELKGKRYWARVKSTPCSSRPNPSDRFCSSCSNGAPRGGGLETAAAVGLRSAAFAWRYGVWAGGADADVVHDNDPAKK